MPDDPNKQRGEDSSPWATSWCDWADKLRVSKKPPRDDVEEVDVRETSDTRRPSERRSADSGRARRAT
jgi:hypothetical protein